MARRNKAWGSKDRESAREIGLGFVAFFVMAYVGVSIGGAVGGFFILGAFPAMFLTWALLARHRLRSRTQPGSTTYNPQRQPTADRGESTESPAAERPRVTKPLVAGDTRRTADLADSSRSGASPLRTQLQHIPNMSGAAFERYMANVFKALGYNARVLGGAGDQGADLLLQKGGERIAVQCKNYRRPVGNPPVQQVLAGKLYHKADHAWVVAPAGYTEGAVALARRTGVRLFDRRSIATLIQQAEQRAEEHDVRAPITNLKEVRAPTPADSEKQVNRAPDPSVGDTVTLATGERLTVHSYESPIAPPTNRQPEEGYEFAAIDVEWCTGQNSGGGQVQANYAYFSLHMPDNTRMQGIARKEPRLPLATLLPGDCVRGWVTFQKPRDVKPRFIIYTKGASVVKWAIQ